MTSTSIARAPSTDGHLRSFRARIAAYPYLTAEREMELAWRVVEKNDRGAAEILVNSHMRLVLKIAKGYAGYGLDIEDIVSEGAAGLVSAIDRFDPSKGFRVSTYAQWWIRASIQEFILRSWSLVRVSNSAEQKKLFFGLRKAKARLGAYGAGELRADVVAAIATSMGVRDDDVVAMNRRLSGDQSLNAPIKAVDGDGAEMQDYLVDESDDQETVLARRDELEKRRAMLQSAMGVLTPRERRVFEARRLLDDPLTLADLGEEFSISRERVRQIEVKAFEKVSASIGSAVAANDDRAMHFPADGDDMAA